ncbi:MAG: hypothetical protein DWQ01_14800 [Planctomycetota bacterium]|nr:MAG: hypothetical protein DWQ01_14800 [Planctomycetota bacterium]
MGIARTSLPLLLLALAATASLPAQDGVVLTTSGVDRLALGGELRGRTEVRDPARPTTNVGSRHDNFGRFRVHLDARINDNVDAFLQLQESVNGGGSPSADTLHQGYANLYALFNTFDFQGGRFEMAYGNERMISADDWSQTGNAFDGARLIYAGDPFQVDFFVTQAVAGQGAAHADVQFQGLYARYNGSPVTVDAYVLRRDDSVLRFDDLTFGALARGDYEGLIWDLEAAFQTGDHGRLDAAGFAFAANAAWTFDQGFSLGAGWDYASGDDDPTDSDDGTFRQLFHYNHTHLGWADIVLWQNVHDFHFDAVFPFDDNWTVEGSLHWLMLAEDRDALYSGMGSAGVATVAGEDAIGTEVDLGLRGQINPNVEIFVGGAQFMAGDGIRANDDQFWVFGQLRIIF